MRLYIKISISILLSVFAFLVVSYYCSKRLTPFDTSLPDPSPFTEVNTLKITNLLTDKPEYSKINKEISRFVRRWELKGASLSIAYNNRLVYSRGFGWANAEDSVEMQPYNVLRVASVSKLITAVAVMKLVEDGKLQLCDTIFGENGLLNDSVFLNIKDKRVKNITVHNLLNHSAGWNVRHGDHMFMKQMISKELGKQLPISLTDIVEFAVTRRRLHFQPGNGGRYGNLGYAILQLVIEKISGIKYEDFVMQNIFIPLRITDVGIAESWDSLKLKNEVRYYEVPEADSILAYDGSRMTLKSRGGNDIRTLGAAGGWAISSVSLVKFMLAIDGDSSFPDIISDESYYTMITKSNSSYPYGWIMVNSNGEHWRSGSLPGTTVLAKTTSNGFTYAFIANSSPWKGSRFPYIISGMMNKVLPKFDSLMLNQNYFIAEQQDTLNSITGEEELKNERN